MITLSSKHILHFCSSLVVNYIFYGLVTGHAGKRIACAVIGYAKENYNKLKNNFTCGRRDDDCNIN